jgi:osmotically-inducible protein OsmY
MTATAGPDGLVALTGTVPTQSLGRELELSCWTVPGVHSLHENLIVGH